MSAEQHEVAHEVVEPSPVTAVAILSPLERVREGLALLAAEAVEVRKLDVTTTSGDKAQRAFRAKCVALRTTIDKTYEEVNKPLLEVGRQARALVAEIKSAIKIYEEAANAEITAREQAAEAARQAKREAAERRATEYRVKIANIRAMALGHGRSSSTVIGEHLTVVRALVIGEAGYAEFFREAEHARGQTIAELEALLADADAREFEQKRLAAEAAKLRRETVLRAIIRERYSVNVGGLMAASLDEVCVLLHDIQSAPPTEQEFGELLHEATQAQQQAVVALQSLADAKIAQVAERERQDLETRRLNAEREEQARIGREVAAALQVQQAAAQAEIDAQRAKVAAEQAELDRQREEVARVERERQEAAEQEKREALAAEEAAEEQRAMGKAHGDAMQAQAMLAEMMTPHGSVLGLLQVALLGAEEMEASGVWDNGISDVVVSIKSAIHELSNTFAITDTERSAEAKHEADEARADFANDR